MKNRWILFILLFLGDNLFAQTSQDIQIHDTRDINLLPNAFHWSSSYAYRARFDFKYNHIVGMPGSGVYSTVLTMPQWPDNSGDKMHQLGFNNGGVFFRQGWPSGAIWDGWRKVLIEDEQGNIGIGTTVTSNGKLTVSGTDINLLRLENEMNGGESMMRFRAKTTEGAYLHADVSLYANGGFLGIKIPHNNSAGSGYQMVIKDDGNIGIGTITPSEKLSVNGNVKAKKIIVSQTGWPDYVFDSSYALRTLSEVEKFIAVNKHLPDMPSAKEVEQKGISVGDNQALLLKKIEEMTLYILQINKRVLELEKENKLHKRKIKQ
jgi:hypothetical protein